LITLGLGGQKDTGKKCGDENTQASMFINDPKKLDYFFILILKTLTFERHNMIELITK
jgi:hypothetical protein